MQRHGVALPAAALQFVLAHPLVASVIPGAVSAKEVGDNLRHLSASIPAAFWSDLKSKGLIEDSRADAIECAFASPRFSEYRGRLAFKRAAALF